MALPRIVADAVARAMQAMPGSARIDPDIAFTEISATTEQVVIPTRHGDCPATVYLPDGGSGGRGIYVNLHGGGWVIRHPEQDDPLCRYLAAHAGVTVINPDYQPAPRSRFPGPVEQAYDVTTWAASPDRSWDGQRLVVGGQSAGGSLTAAVSRLAFEQGGPSIRLQVLMYPVLDLTVPVKDKRTPDKEVFLARMAPIFHTAYCPDAARRSDRLVSPAAVSDTADLTGIAPALVVTAARDILREEGVRYAERLARVGALAGHLDLPDVGHGFNILGAPREVVVEVYQRIARQVLEAVGQPG